MELCFQVKRYKIYFGYDRAAFQSIDLHGKLPESEMLYFLRSALPFVFGLNRKKSQTDENE